MPPDRPAPKEIVLHRGYIKIWRKVQDSGLLQMPNTFTLFIYMLLEAAHKPMRFGTVDLERGQLVSGRYKLSAALGISEQAVRTALDNLHNLNMVSARATNKYTIYTIVNYGNYQDSLNDNNQPTTNQQPTNNQPTTTIQELKNLRMKEEKPLSEYSDEFISFWKSYPKKTGKGEAFKSWKKQRPSITDVLKALEWQRTSQDWIKDNGQYVPNPATYLNQRRWEDEPKGRVKMTTEEFMRSQL